MRILPYGNSYSTLYHHPLPPPPALENTTALLRMPQTSNHPPRDTASGGDGGGGGEWWDAALRSERAVVWVKFASGQDRHAFLHAVRRAKIQVQSNMQHEILESRSLFKLPYESTIALNWRIACQAADLLEQDMKEQEGVT
jgi:hypothetical protein